jgi:hypothetical protein
LTSDHFRVVAIDYRRAAVKYDARFNGVGENATNKAHGARGRYRPPLTIALPRSFLVLTETCVFLAMTSLKTLLMHTEMGHKN